MGWGTGWGEITIPDAIHCSHQDDFYIKMGSDESHFNASFTLRGNVTRRSSLLKRKKSPEGFFCNRKQQQQSYGCSQRLADRLINSCFLTASQS